MQATNPIAKSIAQLILLQLGGSKFIAMTGSKNFLAMGRGLRFDLSRNSSCANRCEITLKADDTYEVLFYRMNRKTFAVKQVALYQGVYFDQLQDIFTSMTGLETSLGTMRRAD